MSLSELFVVDLSTLFVVFSGKNVVKRNGLLPNVSILSELWDLKSDDLGSIGYVDSPWAGSDAPHMRTGQSHSCGV
jgi:hypothetical protein